MVPGLGQAYGGNVVRGVALWLVELSLSVGFVFLMQYIGSDQQRGKAHLGGVCYLLCLIVVGFRLFVIADAVRVARMAKEIPRGRFNRWYVHSIAIIVTILVFNITVTRVDRYVRALWAPSGSMLPTIAIGDHFFVDERVYADVRLPERGHIVAYTRPSDDTTMMARVIAIAGDEIELRNRQVLLNDTAIEEPYAYFEGPPAPGPRDNMEKREVPANSFFVMGDNRDRSYDSRFWGFAHVDGLIGRITWVYWSRNEGWPRWERIGRWIE